MTAPGDADIENIPPEMPTSRTFLGCGRHCGWRRPRRAFSLNKPGGSKCFGESGGLKRAEDRSPTVTTTLGWIRSLHRFGTPPLAVDGADRSSRLQQQQATLLRACAKLARPSAGQQAGNSPSCAALAFDSLARATRRPRPATQTRRRTVQREGTGGLYSCGP